MKLLRRDAVTPSVPGSRRPLGELLVERGVPEAEILAALGEQTGRTPVDPDHAVLEEDAVLAVDAGFARERGIVPLHVDDRGRLHAATPTPDDTGLAAAFSAHVQRPVVPSTSTASGSTERWRRREPPTCPTPWSRARCASSTSAAVAAR